MNALDELIVEALNAGKHATVKHLLQQRARLREIMEAQP